MIAQCRWLIDEFSHGLIWPSNSIFFYPLSRVTRSSENSLAQSALNLVHKQSQTEEAPERAKRLSTFRIPVLVWCFAQTIKPAFPCTSTETCFARSGNRWRPARNKIGVGWPKKKDHAKLVYPQCSFWMKLCTKNRWLEAGGCQSQVLLWKNLSVFYVTQVGTHSLLNGACAHYVMVSRFQWKPFWLATQRDPQNDWTATQKSCELWRIRAGSIWLAHHTLHRGIVPLIRVCR